MFHPIKPLSKIFLNGPTTTRLVNHVKWLMNWLLMETTLKLQHASKGFQPYFRIKLLSAITNIQDFLRQRSFAQKSSLTLNLTWKSLGYLNISQIKFTQFIIFQSFLKSWGHLHWDHISFNRNQERLSHLQSWISTITFQHKFRDFPPLHHQARISRLLLNSKRHTIMSQIFKTSKLISLIILFQLQKL